MSDLARAERIIAWHKYIISPVGMWPLQVKNQLFAPFILYIAYHCILGFLDIMDVINDSNKLLRNLTEYLIMVLVLAKFIIFRLKCSKMADILRNIKNDFLSERYHSETEKMDFIRYNNICRRYIKFGIAIVSLSSLNYYFKNFSIVIETLMQNSSIEFTYEVLPFRTRPPFPIHSKTAYLAAVLYQGIMSLLIIVTLAGLDGFVITMLIHVCGQLAALSAALKDIFKDGHDYSYNFVKFVTEHMRLINLKETLEASYNFMIFMQVTVYTLALCLSSFQLMNSFGFQNLRDLSTYAIFVTGVVFRVFVFCFTGQCLIDESLHLCEAFYNCDWYEALPSALKQMQICMIRFQRPLTVTAGKFVTLSYDTFTSITKTAMAYLSVLQAVA